MDSQALAFKSTIAQIMRYWNSPPGLSLSHHFVTWERLNFHQERCTPRTLWTRDGWPFNNSHTYLSPTNRFDFTRWVFYWGLIRSVYSRWILTKLSSILGVLCGLVIEQVFIIVANIMEMRWRNHNFEGMSLPPSPHSLLQQQQWNIMSFDLN